MLRDRHFLLLWLVNITTTLAIELFTVTIIVAIFEQTNSTLQAAGTMVARTLPPFLLGPVAGVLVDRFPRRNVLLAMDLARLLLVGGALVLLRANDAVPVIGVYLILAGLSAAGVFHLPARQSLIPSLVARAYLVNANSFILASNQIVMALSYTIGGWLILVMPLRQIALIIMALFGLALAAALAMRVPVRAGDVGDGRERFVQALRSGWRYLSEHPIARPLTVMETIEHVPHGIWTGALMLAFTTQALQGNAADWGYQVTGYFSGMIVGSLAAFGLRDWLHRFPGRIIATNALLAGVLTLAFSASPTVWIAVVWAFVFGPPFAIRDVAQDTLLQGTVADEQLGRVYATREMLRSLVFMFAGLFFAWLSDIVPIRAIYVVGGTLYILTGIYAFSNRALRDSQMQPAGPVRIEEQEKL